MLALGTYDPFKVKTRSDSPIDFRKSKSPMDLVVRRHSYDPGGSTGWHSPRIEVLRDGDEESRAVRLYESAYTDFVSAAGTLGLTECQGVLL